MVDNFENSIDFFEKQLDEDDAIDEDLALDIDS